MTNDYKRHRTTTLFAAANVVDRTVIGRNMQRHRHQEFVRFLNAIEREVPAGKTVHAILDNYAAHKHPAVRQWLGRNPRWTFHFTPSSASWLNVEGFFATLTKPRHKSASSDPSPTFKPPSIASSSTTTGASAHETICRDSALSRFRRLIPGQRAVMTPPIWRISSTSVGKMDTSANPRYNTFQPAVSIPPHIVLFLALALFSQRAPLGAGMVRILLFLIPGILVSGCLSMHPASDVTTSAPDIAGNRQRPALGAEKSIAAVNDAPVSSYHHQKPRVSVAASPPAYTVNKSCKAGSSAIEGDTYETCMKQESDAKTQVFERWATYSAADRKQCVVNDGDSYIELLTCFEVKDWMKHPKQVGGVTGASPSTNKSDGLTAEETGQPGTGPVTSKSDNAPEKTSPSSPADNTQP